MNFKDMLGNEVIVLDGAMGTMIQNLDLTDADFGGGDFRMLSDLLTVSHPEHIEEIHLAYFRAGANAVETNTFGATSFRLEEYDFAQLDAQAFARDPMGRAFPEMPREEIAYWLARRGAEAGCRARERYRCEAEYDGRPLFVLGSLGPSNHVLTSTRADLKTSTFDAIGANFAHEVRGLLDGGADALLFETQQDALELKAAVMGAQDAMAAMGRVVPIIAQVTVDRFAKMQIFNTDIHAALTTLQGIGIDVFGINCSIGPDLMGPAVEKMARFSHLPVSVIPNAGLPVSENGRTVYKFSPDAMAGLLGSFVAKHGVAIVGGCCGTGPEHIRAMKRAIQAGR